MRPGDSGHICQVDGPDQAVRRLLELGLTEGSWIELVHEAPFGKDPIAVKVRGGLLAMRRREANQVWVRRGGAK
jgi:ferrous iron transport protein A